MLTFEKLIQETTQRLAPENPMMSAAMVRDVLTDVGIDDALRDAVPSPQGRLIVYAITITGQKMHAESALQTFTYSRRIGSGLSAWVGENGTGKSTILSCLLWALTGSDSNIPKRMRPWIHDVLVEFSIGPAQYTSYAARNADGVAGRDNTGDPRRPTMLGRLG